VLLTIVRVPTVITHLALCECVYSVLLLEGVEELPNGGRFEVEYSLFDVLLPL
jgi:hypothetical protein